MGLMDRNRPYYGQPHTDRGTRGKTEIKGITFRDLRDCFIRAVLLSGYGVVPEKKLEEAHKGEGADLAEKDLYGFDLDKLDPGAIANNLSCEVERMMGIYPNVPPLVHGATIEETLANIGAPMISMETAMQGGLEAVIASSEMSADAVEWKARAIALWKIADDIDKAGVVDGDGKLGPGDKEWFHREATLLAKKRHAILERVGDNLSIPEA